VNNKINNAQYDGVFADNAPREIPTWVPWNIPYSNFKPADIARWHTDTIGFLQYVKANLLPGKIIVINSDDWNSIDYLNVVDGMSIEGFAHATWETPDQHSFGTFMLDFISQASATGKIVWPLAGTAIPSGTSTAAVAKVVKFCYAAYLLALNGPQMHWGFNNWGSPDGSRGYYPILDTDIGQVTGAYYSSQNVYMRDFTGGKVLLNPSSSSRSVNLGSSYKLLDGTVVSSIVLGAWSGEILLSPT
jgi:hypothetical protein